MSAAGWTEFAIAVRVCVALVFLLGAIRKLRHRLSFEGVIANYRVLPEFMIRPVALALPCAEILVGAGLLAWISPWPAAAASALLLTFAAAMAVNLLRGREHIDCGCFDSTLKQTLRWSLVARNGLLILMLLATLTVGSTAAKDVSGWALVEGGLAGVAACIILLSGNALWVLPPTRRTPARRAQSHAQETP